MNKDSKKWTPLSSQAPPAKGVYWVTTSEGVALCPYDPNDGGFGSCYFPNRSVIAWMELEFPEPYEEVSLESEE